MAISRAQLAKELEPGLNALFGLEYARYDNESAEIYDTESSERAFEEEVMMPKKRTLQGIRMRLSLLLSPLRKKQLKIISMIVWLRAIRKLWHVAWPTPNR
jgi:hypothetical protein